MLSRTAKRLITTSSQQRGLYYKPSSSVVGVGANACGFQNTNNKYLVSLISKATISSSTLSDIAASANSTPASLKGEWNAQLTKIVSTIGPTSEQLPVLQDMIRTGVRIMRLNFSHATEEEVELRIKNLNLCEGRHGASLGHPDTKNVRAVLLDTRGPEIRMGKLRNDFSGHETIVMEAGSNVKLHTTSEWADAGSTVVSFVHIT